MTISNILGIITGFLLFNSMLMIIIFRKIENINKLVEILFSNQHEKPPWYKL